MSPTETVVRLRPVVRFREFPFGTRDDPSMREFLTAQPWDRQEPVTRYLRSGLILAHPLGADLMDWFDRPNRANPVLDGGVVGGVTPLTDGVWFWPAGLIHFVERYNVRLPEEFVEHAARAGWTVNKEAVPRCRYDWSYFG